MWCSLWLFLPWGANIVSIVKLLDAFADSGYTAQTGQYYTADLTLYDYYTDNEYKTTGGDNNENKGENKNGIFNKALYATGYVNSSYNAGEYKYPLYLGLQYPTQGNDNSTNFMLANPNQYHYSMAANSQANSHYNGNSVAGAAMGLVDNVLTEKTIKYEGEDYTYKAITQNGVELPYFSPEWLSKTLEDVFDSDERSELGISDDRKSHTLGNFAKGYKFRFNRDSDGYYRYVSYNKDDYTATGRSEGAGNIIRYDGLECSGTTFSVVKGTSSNTKNDLYSKPGFFPWRYIDNDDKDFGYAAKFEIDFTMTSNGHLYERNNDGSIKDGQTANPTGAPIEFNFRGDDDVWVFIDDYLVLDVGGAHGAVSASINFAGDSTYEYPYAKTDYVKDKNDYQYGYGQRDVTPGSTSNGGVVDLTSVLNTVKLFNDSEKTHKLTVFYIERGTLESNCEISFNFQISDNISVKNNIDVSPVNDTLEPAALAAAKKEGVEYVIASDSGTSKVPSPDVGVDVLRDEDDPIQPATYYNLAFNTSHGGIATGVTEETQRVAYGKTVLLPKGQKYKNTDDGKTYILSGWKVGGEGDTLSSYNRPKNLIGSDGANKTVTMTAVWTKAPPVPLDAPSAPALLVVKHGSEQYANWWIDGHNGGDASSTLQKSYVTDREYRDGSWQDKSENKDAVLIVNLTDKLKKDGYRFWVKGKGRRKNGGSSWAMDGDRYKYYTFQHCQKNTEYKDELNGGSEILYSLSKGTLSDDIAKVEDSTLYVKGRGFFYWELYDWASSTIKYNTTDEVLASSYNSTGDSDINTFVEKYYQFYNVLLNKASTGTVEDEEKIALYNQALTAYKKLKYSGNVVGSTTWTFDDSSSTMTMTGVEVIEHWIGSDGTGGALAGVTPVVSGTHDTYEYSAETFDFYVFVGGNTAPTVRSSNSYVGLSDNTQAYTPTAGDTNSAPLYNSTASDSASNHATGSPVLVDTTNGTYGFYKVTGVPKYVVHKVLNDSDDSLVSSENLPNRILIDYPVYTAVSGDEQGYDAASQTVNSTALFEESPTCEYASTDYDYLCYYCGYQKIKHLYEDMPVTTYSSDNYVFWLYTMNTKDGSDALTVANPPTVEYAMSSDASTWTAVRTMRDDSSNAGSQGVGRYYYTKVPKTVQTTGEPDSPVYLKISYSNADGTAQTPIITTVDAAMTAAGNNNAAVYTLTGTGNNWYRLVTAFINNNALAYAWFGNGSSYPMSTDWNSTTNNMQLVTSGNYCYMYMPYATLQIKFKNAASGSTSQSPSNDSNYALKNMDYEYGSSTEITESGNPTLYALTATSRAQSLATDSSVLRSIRPRTAPAQVTPPAETEGSGEATSAEPETATSDEPASAETETATSDEPASAETETATSDEPASAETEAATSDEPASAEPETATSDEPASAEPEGSGEGDKGVSTGGNGNTAGKFENSTPGTFIKASDTNFKLYDDDFVNRSGGDMEFGVRSTDAQGRFNLLTGQTAKFTYQFNRSSNVKIAQTGSSYSYSPNVVVNSPEENSQLNYQKGFTTRKEWAAGVLTTANTSDDATQLYNKYSTSWTVTDENKNHSGDSISRSQRYTLLQNGYNQLVIQNLDGTVPANDGIHLIVTYTNTVRVGDLTIKKTFSEDAIKEILNYRNQHPGYDPTYYFQIEFSHVLGDIDANTVQYNGKYDITKWNATNSDYATTENAEAYSTSTNDAAIPADKYGIAFKFSDIYIGTSNTYDANYIKPLTLTIKDIPVDTTYTINEIVGTVNTTTYPNVPDVSIGSVTVKNYNNDDVTATGTAGENTYTGKITSTVDPNFDVKDSTDDTNTAIYAGENVESYSVYYETVANSDNFSVTAVNDLTRQEAYLIIGKKINHLYYNTVESGTPSSSNSDNPAGLASSDATVGGGSSTADDRNGYEDATDAEQSFIFKIEKIDKTSGDTVGTFYETISFPDGATLDEYRYKLLKVDPSYKYRITELTDWSWKYSPGTSNVDPDEGEGDAKNKRTDTIITVVEFDTGSTEVTYYKPNGDTATKSVSNYAKAEFVNNKKTTNRTDGTPIRDIEGDTSIKRNIITKAA